MGKFILGLGLLTVAANAATFDSVYKGKDARSKTDCELQVIKTYYTGNTGKWEDLKVEASTNYGHDGETPGTFILETNPKGAKQMAGTTD